MPICSDAKAGHGPPTIFYGGLMRMGSLSLAHALDVLGFRAHHALEADWDEWQILRHGACNGFSKDDLDRLFGTYDCITDIGSLFAPDILKCYPDIRVIVIQRDFDSWWHSFYNTVVYPACNCNRKKTLLIRLVEGLAGVAPCTTTRMLLWKFMNVQFEDWTTFHKGIQPCYTTAEDFQKLKAAARRKYDEHYALIRSTVPSERRLEYALEDGWEPLCHFLGRDVPDVPFPRVNDVADHKRRLGLRIVELLKLSYQRPFQRSLGKLRKGLCH